MGKLLNKTRGDVVLLSQLEMADSFWRRAVGLLGRSPLPDGVGLWIRPCGSVHTFGMRFALDLIFLDRADRVVRVARNVRPWRVVWGGADAVSVLELRAGQRSSLSVEVGDQLLRQ